MSRRGHNSRKWPRTNEAVTDAPVPATKGKPKGKLLQEKARQIFSNAGVGSEPSSSSRRSSAQSKAAELMPADISDSSSGDERPPAPATKRNAHGQYTKKEKGKGVAQVQTSASFMAVVSRAHGETVYGFKDHCRHKEVPAAPVRCQRHFLVLLYFSYLFQLSRQSLRSRRWLRHQRRSQSIV